MASRLKEEKLRNYDMPSVKLSKDELQVLKLKAALETKEDVAEFVRKAIREYQPSLPQVDCCGKETKSILRYIELAQVTVSDRVTTVKVINYPHQVCDICGEEYIDLRVGAEVESIIESDIDNRVKETRGRLPQELIYDFNNWIES